MISLCLLDFDTAGVAAALGVPGFEDAVLDRLVSYIDVPQVVGLLELFPAAGRLSENHRLLACRKNSGFLTSR